MLTARHHDTQLIGEMPVATERVIVAPAAGLFEPLPMTDHVLAGTVVGFVNQREDRTPVVSQWQGRFMGHLADTGDRVRDAQALAWVRPTL